MAGSVEAGESPSAPLVESSASTGPVAGPVRRFRGRFAVVYGLLGLVLGGAVAGLVVLLARPGAVDGPPWSAWTPPGDRTEYAQEIADHVAARYHLVSGRQIVGVQAAPLRVQNVPIGAIAIRRLPAAGAQQVPVDVFQPAGTFVYILCGFGKDCAIDSGTPSSERLRLLRREGLELALYTFRYVDGASSVVAFLPPAPGDKPSLALFFEKGDLGSELDHPLRLTLPDSRPPLPNAIPADEAVTIDRLTTPSLFRFEFQQLQDGTAVLVLDDPRLPVTKSTQSSGGSSGAQTGQQGGGQKSAPKKQQSSQ